MLDAIREGKLDNVLDHPEPEVLAAVKELDVQWLNSESVHSDRNLTMQLRVTEGGAAASGARLTFRLARPGGNAVLHAGSGGLRRRGRNQD